MPASNDRGKHLDDLCTELRDRSPITRMCGRCDYTITGTLADTTQPMAAHLRSVHGITPSSPPRKRARMFVSETKLEDSIAKAREAGSTVDYHEHDAA